MFTKLVWFGNTEEFIDPDVVEPDNEEDSTSHGHAHNPSDSSDGGDGKDMPAWQIVLIIVGVIVLACCVAYCTHVQKEKKKSNKAPYVKLPGR